MSIYWSTAPFISLILDYLGWAMDQLCSLAVHVVSEILIQIYCVTFAGEYFLGGHLENTQLVWQILILGGSRSKGHASGQRCLWWCNGWLPECFGDSIWTLSFLEKDMESSLFPKKIYTGSTAAWGLWLLSKLQGLQCPCGHRVAVWCGDSKSHPRPPTQLGGSGFDAGMIKKKIWQWGSSFFLSCKPYKIPIQNFDYLATSPTRKAICRYFGLTERAPRFLNLVGHVCALIWHVSVGKRWI